MRKAVLAARAFGAFVFGSAAIAEDSEMHVTKDARGKMRRSGG
jgi:hypothetical protein